jgi:thiosulfate/3-mercaptopyruvate sulfurtransferase
VKNNRTALTILAALAVAPSTGWAQSARQELLVTADQVAAQLDEENLVILHVGDEDDYKTEHIPGAHYVQRFDMRAERGEDSLALILELPKPEVFQAALRRYGVTDESRIVVYWGSEWVTPTTRMVFTLDWAGLGDRTVLMDGGLDAWKAGGHAVTAEAPEPGHGTVTIHPRDLVVTADWVRHNSTNEGYALVDGRAPAFFEGVREDRGGKAGHIPGAGNVPWTALIDESLHLKSPSELASIFESAGVGSGDTVVAYCHIGQYATTVLFAARTLGYDVRLYDGAFQDWAQRDLPVEATEGGN